MASHSSEDWYGRWTGTALVVAICTGISISNALELLLLVVVTFKKRKGLYFWSLLVTSFSVLPYSIGYLIEYFRIKSYLLGDIMNNIGWLVLVTGQSVVLYSRLGVILHNPNVLRLVLWMIIVNGVVFYVTTTVIHYATYSSDDAFNRAATIIEKIQMTGFCIQEFIISGLYVLEVWRLSKILVHEKSRQTMWELLVINLVIIALDIALLALEYLGLSVLERVFKGTAYSYKLKMELAILGKLVSMAQTNSTAAEFPRSSSLPEHVEHQADQRPKKSQTGLRNCHLDEEER